MKNLVDYIEEGLLSRKVSTKAPIRYNPKDTDELINIIVDLLKKGQTNLNCIDVTNITDMRYIFHDVNTIVEVKDIDISDWNVSNVTNMYGMFWNCQKFNSDLSKWNISEVISTVHMFDGCEIFKSDLSKWDVSKVTDMFMMFSKCYEFDSDLSKWNMNKVSDTRGMFNKCITLKKNKKIPTWYKG